MPAGGSDSDIQKTDNPLVNRFRPSRHIDSRTALYVVIGDPVAHSLSPVMHNAAFDLTGINAVYVALRVTDPAGAVAAIRTLSIAGVSVTIPHKTTVIDYLDQLDPVAETIGAVNTIVNQNGKLIGYNTDGLGAVRALAKKISIAHKRVTIIGAGGAARAIGYAVTEQGARVTIANRTVQRGEALAGDLRTDFLPLRDFTGNSCDVVINTSPVGMHPDTDATPIDDSILRSDMVVMDAVYNPLVTRLLRAAGRTGCITVSGADMFVYQGAAQFELWTGKPAPVDVMRIAVLSAL
ncbi:MAG: shikimate dehydrogenase [Thermodesulfobacteriota bacterium]|nr:shikimate dehydrogenase [Thermodesulfobacteriota bacterium]